MIGEIRSISGTVTGGSIAWEMDFRSICDRDSEVFGPLGETGERPEAS